MTSLLSASLESLSLSTVELDEPLVFGESPERDLTHLRFLRDVTSHAVRLRWSMAGAPSFPIHNVVHLVPPTGAATPEAETYARKWAESYRYGSFYFRRGPNFVTVKDVRPGVDAVRLTIDEGAETFLALSTMDTLRDRIPTGLTDEVLADAVAAGLLLRIGDAVLLLPYQMRHWPVPYIAV